MIERWPRNSPEPWGMTLAPVGDAEGDPIRTLQMAGLGALSDSTFETISKRTGIEHFIFMEFHGMICKFFQVIVQFRLVSWNVEMVPVSDFLKFATDSKIAQTIVMKPYVIKNIFIYFSNDLFQYISRYFRIES